MNSRVPPHIAPLPRASNVFFRVRPRWRKTGGQWLDVAIEGVESSRAMVVLPGPAVPQDVEVAGHSPPCGQRTFRR